ncbi:MAG TPA: hypothetical protein PK644_04860, partial [bacterium]|nr:hypothetical protein [bacterium]
VTTACLLNLMSAIGVEGCQVKWPNDIICKGKKIAGILIEQTGFCSIVGVGINVNNRVSNFLTGAVSVVEVTGKELPLVDVLREMVIVHRTLFGQTLDKKEGFLTWRGGLLKNE